MKAEQKFDDTQPAVTTGNNTNNKTNKREERNR